MATVQVDLSEYDMLREAKDKAEKEAKELKETVKGLENKSRVIIKTKYKNSASLNSALDSITTNLYNYIIYNRVYNIAELKTIIKMIIDSFTDKEHESCQYIGFDDVEESVKASYQKQMENAIDDYKKTRDSYLEYKANVKQELDREIKEYYSNEIESLKKTNSDNIINYENTIKSKDEEIEKLKNEISELSKSKEDKIAELIKIIEDNKNKLNDLLDKKEKNSIFKKLFKS